MLRLSRPSNAYSLIHAHDHLFRMINLTHRLTHEPIQLLAQRRVHFLVAHALLYRLHRPADWPDRPPARTPISTAGTPSKRPECAFYVSTFRGAGADDAELHESSNQSNGNSRDRIWRRSEASEWFAICLCPAVIKYPLFCEWQKSEERESRRERRSLGRRKQR